MATKKPIAKKLNNHIFPIISITPTGYLCIKNTGKDYLLDIVFYCPKNRGEDIYEDKEKDASTNEKG